MVIGSQNPEGRRELIQKKAYELYVQRGKTPGREVEDWLNAEKLVEREMQGQKAPTLSEPSMRGTVSSLRGAPSKVGGFKRAAGE